VGKGKAVVDGWDEGSEGKFRGEVDGVSLKKETEVLYWCLRRSLDRKKGGKEE